MPVTSEESDVRRSSMVTEPAVTSSENCADTVVVTATPVPSADGAWAITVGATVSVALVWNTTSTQ